MNSRSGADDPDEPDEVAFGRPRRPYGRGLLSALVAVSVLAVAALAVSSVALWRTESAPPDGVARHGLSADHAACFAFGRLERRMALTINREAQQSADLPAVPTVKKRLREEIETLDALGRRFPEADHRLVDAFARVADASAWALRMPREGWASDTFVDGLVGRSDAVDAAKQACSEAGFDMEELEPR